MGKYLFKVSSITNAQRGQKLLSSHGITSSVARIQNPNQSDGCGYTILVKSNGEKAEEILVENGIRIVGIDIN